jgi:nitrate/nitrite-specific signal transduction histidine kinase
VSNLNYKSVAKKNVLILILSLLPFLIGLSFSVYNSSDRQYFSVAINISGSQRMRTMLISNYAQQLNAAYISNGEQKFKDIQTILINELEIYEKYYNALSFGDSSLGIKENDFKNIYLNLQILAPFVDKYIESGVALIEHPNEKQYLWYIIDNAMTIKNDFDKITELYQMENDRYI